MAYRLAHGPSQGFFEFLRDLAHDLDIDACAHAVDEEFGAAVPGGVAHIEALESGSRQSVECNLHVTGARYDLGEIVAGAFFNKQGYPAHKFDLWRQCPPHL